MKHPSTFISISLCALVLTGIENADFKSLPLHHTRFICNYLAEPQPQITLSNGLNSCKEHWTPPFLHNYPIKSALMSSLSFCPEASPHSVCKVRVPSLPQFDSVKAWKQIKSCCFSQSWRDTEPVRTRLTRGSFATCCFCLWWGRRNVGTSLNSWFCSVFLSFAPAGHLWEGSGGTWDFFFPQFCFLVAFFLSILGLSQLQWNNLFSRINHEDFFFWKAPFSLSWFY